MQAWAIAATVLVAIGFVIFMVVLVTRANRARRKETEAKVKAEKALATALGSLHGANQTVKGLEAERARLEKVVGLLRSDISEMERDAIACQDPKVVKRKLGEMLSRTTIK